MSLLIFLDLDGVLRKKDSPLYKLDRDCLQRFEETLRYFPEVEIVITSPWREAFSLTEIRKLFSNDIAQRIVGMTPVAQYLEDHHHYNEVLAYLRQNNNGSQEWIAIDYDPDQYPPDCNILIIDSNLGFDSQAAQQLSNLLKQGL